MSSDEQQIRELVASWMSATKAGDADTVLSLMADDAKFLVAGQAPFGKDAFAPAAEQQKAMKLEIDGTSEVLEVSVSGDFAYAITGLSVSIRQPDTKPVVRSGHTLTVFKKVGGKWLLFRDANLLSPAQ